MSFAEFLKKVKEFFLNLFGIEIKPEVVADEVVEPESPEVVTDEESKPEFKVYTPMHPWYPLPHIKFRRKL
jgi:hypothetical protein